MPYPIEMFEYVASLRNRNITTSSFGIGVNFDEQMMHGIAKAGNGNYFFIDQVGTVLLLYTCLMVSY